jgi:hypothetical protein
LGQKPRTRVQRPMLKQGNEMNFKTHHITSILFGLFATLNTSIGIQAQTIPAGAKDSLVSLAGFLDNPVAEERVQSLLEARDNEKSLDGVVKAATKLGLLLDRKTYSLQQVRLWRTCNLAAEQS